MEGVELLSPDLAELLIWLASPESTISVVKLLQAAAAAIAILGSSLGVYKTWRFAERQLGLRLTDFVGGEKRKLTQVREHILQARQEYAVGKFPKIHIRTNEDLQYALKNFNRNKLFNIDEELIRARNLTEDKIQIAKKSLSLQERQKALTYLLLGAEASRKGDHSDALTHFKCAVAIDPYDIEALEYVGDEYIELHKPRSALEYFEKVNKIAKAKGDQLTLARAHRKSGEAYEMPSINQPRNARLAYLAASDNFPDTGPLIELALINKLRGIVNLAKGNLPLAGKCLRDAQLHYSQILLNDNRQYAKVTDDVAEVAVALQNLAAADTPGSS